MTKNIIIGLLLALLAGGGAYSYFGGVEGLKNIVSSSEDKQDEAEPELQIYTIEKVLVTLTEPGQTAVHHAQLDVVLTSFDAKAVVTLKKLDPLLRNIILEKFSNKTFSQLKEMKDFSALQNEVQEAFVATLAKYKIELELLDVKLSKMVLQ